VGGRLSLEMLHFGRCRPPSGRHRPRVDSSGALARLAGMMKVPQGCWRSPSVDAWWAAADQEAPWPRR
jgi:hypothetical protein